MHTCIFSLKSDNFYVGIFAFKQRKITNIHETWILNDLKRGGKEKDALGFRVCVQFLSSPLGGGVAPRLKSPTARSGSVPDRSCRRF